MYLGIGAIFVGIGLLLFVVVPLIGAVIFCYVKKKREPHYEGTNKTILNVVSVGVSLFLVTVCVLIGCVFYFNFFAGETKFQRIYGVGSKWENDDMKITFNSFDSVTTDYSVEVTLNFTVVPTIEWNVEEQEVYWATRKVERMSFNKDKSIEKSGFNIFETKITEETVCIFVFDMPLSFFRNDDGTEGKWAWNVSVFLPPAVFSLDIASPYSDNRLLLK